MAVPPKLQVAPESVIATCDNVHLAITLQQDQFLHSFWEDHTQAHFVPKGSPVYDLQEALLPGLHQPGRFNSVTQVLQTSALYTPEETLLYRSLIEYPVMGLPTSPQVPAARWEFTPHFFVFVPVTSLNLTPEGRLLCPRELTIDMQPYYGGMFNLRLSCRSSILFACCGAWMALQQSVFSRRPLQDPFHGSPMVLVSFRLLQDSLWHLISTSQARFWNRRYVDFHLHVTSGRLRLTKREQATVRMVGLQVKHNFVFLAVTLFAACPQNNSIHPRTAHLRYMHMYTGQNFCHFPSPDGDWMIPSELVLQARRSRL